MEGHKIIKAMRLHLGMTQAEAAKKAGISLDVYQKCENCKGYIMRGKFAEVCRVIEIMHLNPHKFFKQRYELDESVSQVVSRRTSGPPNYFEKKLIRDHCPVSCIRSQREDKRSK